MLPQEIIRKKRDNQKLTKEEIDFFVGGIEDWSITDGQISAMMMAACINDLYTDEIINFVNAVVNTGMILNWDNMDLNGPVASVYAMPGVGDKLEIIAAPVLAACGIYVPMICERMLYHAGGTLDKLDSIRGFASRPSLSRFRKALRESGCAFMTPTEQIAPTDLRIEAIRDITATVSNVSLMIMSMLIKKVASGIKNLTVDVKVGSGAFTPTEKSAQACADKIMECSPAFGLTTDITFSDMNHVIGMNVGNAIEIHEVWAYLTGTTGQRDPEIHALTKRVCTQVLLQNKAAQNAEEADKMIERALGTGNAAERFGRMLYEMGVSPAFMNNPEPFLETAQIIRPVFPEREGYIESMNMRWIGLSVLQMGAGHLYQDQKIDYSAGYTNICRPGMYVSPRIPLAFVHANDMATAETAATHLKGAVKISPEKPV